MDWKSPLQFSEFSPNQFGDGLADTVWPSRVEVVEDLLFASFEGEVNALSGFVSE